MRFLNVNKQSWIYNWKVDSIFILSPPFICLALVFIFPALFINHNFDQLTWLVLVVFIDVAHVYSTLFRTYFHKPTFDKNKLLFTITPIVSLVISVFIYSIQPILFWRLLAYLAVFHFIRQQYGFVKLYSRNDTFNKIQSTIDTVTIYASTIYPLVYWHFSDDRKFKWFIENDFVTHKSQLVLDVSFAIYVSIIISYLLKETYIYYSTKNVNLAKNIIILGTLISWYFGIVYFNSDITFSLLNIVCHGIPYMALVWIYSMKQKPNDYSLLGKPIFTKFGILFFLITILIFAYSEEGLWDFFVWNEHESLFSFLPSRNFFIDKSLITILVPLLSVPQITHYVIDGFIWKISKEKIV